MEIGAWVKVNTLRYLGENKDIETGTSVKVKTLKQVLWYKYYSGGWCTWPTPLKYPESKSKSNEA